jgi:N-acetylmuramoyl-L-alanine amidase
MQVPRIGDRNPAVAEIRSILAGLGLLDNSDPGVDDLFDRPTELALRAFQQRRGLTVDAVVGPETYRAVQAARWRLGDRIIGHSATHAFVGDDVTHLQRQLLEIGYNTGRVDGHFGPLTAAALRQLQRDLGLLADGVCGPETLRGLRQLEARRVVGGSPQLLREQIVVADAGPRLVGKRIVIDPGHGGSDRGWQCAGESESAIVFDLATRLEGRLIAQGVTTWLTRGRHHTIDEAERAAFANAQAADLVVSVHMDGSANPHANGVATYYFGSDHSSSTIGERFAGLVQREIVARTGMLDARSHPKSWTLLLLTAMPTVRVEVGYLTSREDRERLCSAAFRDVVAEAMLVAIQRLYLPQEQDPQTGVLVLPAFAS